MAPTTCGQVNSLSFAIIRSYAPYASILLDSRQLLQPLTLTTRIKCQSSLPIIAQLSHDVAHICHSGVSEKAHVLLARVVYQWVGAARHWYYLLLDLLSRETGRQELKAPCAFCPAILRGCHPQQPPPLLMVHAKDVIAIIVILHLTIGVLLGICICCIRRKIPPPDTTISTDDNSSTSIYTTEVPTPAPAPASIPAVPAPASAPPAPPQPPPPNDTSFNLPSHQSGAFNLPRRTGGGASAHRKIRR